jgi:3-oxoacyl-[acyl-carrier-protein] synthase III
MMTTTENILTASTLGVRMRTLGFYLPGHRITLDTIEMSPHLRARLGGLGQEFTYQSDESSTELALCAAKDAMAQANLAPENIGLVISAPTLLTSYGFEIPAIGIRAALGLNNADCLNIAQGCVGFLAAMRLAAHFLKSEPNRGDVLVVTACKASTLTENFSHGAFFWGDAGAACIVTTEPGRGLHLEAYAEKSSTKDWGAMRLRHGDSVSYASCSPAQDLRITVNFTDERAQADYIMGEQERCGALIDSLLAAGGLSDADINAVLLPSFGRNRVPLLLAGHKALKDKVKSDFRFAHMGGVDVLFFLSRILNKNPPSNESWYLALTPAFTAQWGGLLLRHSG